MLYDFEVLTVMWVFHGFFFPLWFYVEALMWLWRQDGSLMNKYWKVDISTAQHRLCVFPLWVTLRCSILLAWIPLQSPGAATVRTAGSRWRWPLSQWVRCLVYLLLRTFIFLTPPPSASVGLISSSMDFQRPFLYLFLIRLYYFALSFRKCHRKPNK